MPRLSRVALPALLALTVVSVTAGIRPAVVTPHPALADRLEQGAEPTPVLVELFTSEGCSSCPSADALLRELVATQPVEGALIIGLSEHVDYWNRLGWTDPFSEASFSARQSAYASAASSSTIYTPQMVVDGTTEFVGSDRARALAVITAAAGRAKAVASLDWHNSSDGESATLDVRIGPDGSPNTPVWVAITEDGLSVAVPRGENTGRTLAHDRVTRRLTQHGRTSRSGTFTKTLKIPLDPAWRRDALRITVFSQHSGGPVTAVGTTRPRTEN